MSDRLAEIEARTRGWIPIAEWGPKCAGCGGDEFRLDGYCSLECRDFHSDEDIEWLLARVRELETALDDIIRAQQHTKTFGVSCEECEGDRCRGHTPEPTLIARAALVSAVGQDVPATTKEDA